MRPRISTAVLGAGALAVVAAAAWWLAAPRLVPRLPAGWERTMRFVGGYTVPDSTGAFPQQSTPSVYTRHTAVRGPAPGGGVRFETSYTIVDPTTRAITYQYERTHRVDPRTGAHLDPLGTTAVAVFPRGAQRTTYRWTSNYVEDLPVAYLRTDTLDGLDVYVYQYTGRAEYTESYRGTEQYPGTRVPPGHEIRCSDDAFYIRVFVEPVSGSIARLEEGCPSGDYIYVAGTDRKVAPILKWYGSTDGDALVEGVAWASGARDAYRWKTRWGPSLLAGAGLVLLALGAVLRRRAA